MAFDYAKVYQQFIDEELAAASATAWMIPEAGKVRFAGGKTVEILCEDFDQKRGLYLGRDEYGRMGYFRSDTDRIGEFVKLNISQTSGVSLEGELTQEKE